MKNHLLLHLLMTAAGWLWADRMAAQTETDWHQQLIEIITENQDGGEEFDFTELGERIETWQRHRLDLNSEEIIELAQWNILSDFAYQKLREHIQRHGPLLSVLELQAIQGFAPDLIRMLQLIAEVKGRDVTTSATPFGRMLWGGRKEIYIRGGRQFEKAEGYSEDPPDYEGSPDKVYFRARHKFGNVLSYGFTGEKDAGEAFFKKSNPGFDFNSFHFSLSQYTPWLKTLVIGDFTASFGQGLILHSGYGGGKSSFVTAVKRTGYTLRPYTSVDENNFQRGVGASIRPNPYTTITLFGSRQLRDANLVVDTIRDGPDIIDIQSDVSSLQTSGLHRTESEISDEDVIDLMQGGIQINYQRKRYHISLNGLHSKLGAPLYRREDLYNQFYFQGEQLTNVSLDYGAWIGGVHVFGETAMSDNGAIATVNGLLAGLDRRVVGAVLFRSYDKSYQALSPNAFGEGSLANNEVGLYTGLEVQPGTRWKIQVYHDIWSHPWLRFNIDSPTEGKEYFARLTYTVKRRLDIYAQYRSKTSAINLRPAGSAIADVVDQIRTQARLHIQNAVTKAVQLRTRLEWTTWSREDEYQNGFGIYQDFIYKPIGSPWSMTARLTLFDTDDYETRIYTFENDLIYYYAIPAFSGEGSRYYVTLRYKGIRNLTMEIKYAQTYLPGVTSIGSGNDEIPGQRRSELRGQVIYRFD